MPPGQRPSVVTAWRAAWRRHLPALSVVLVAGLIAGQMACRDQRPSPPRQDRTSAQNAPSAPNAPSAQTARSDRQRLMEGPVDERDAARWRTTPGDTLWGFTSNLDMPEIPLANTPAAFGVLDLTANTLLWLDAEVRPTLPPKVAEALALRDAGRLVTVGSLARRYEGASPAVRRALQEEATWVFGMGADDWPAVELVSALRGAPGDPEGTAGRGKREGEIQWYTRDPALRLPRAPLPPARALSPPWTPRTPARP